MYAKLRQFKLNFSQNIKKPTQIIDPSQPANLLLSIKLYLHSINKTDNYFLHFKTSVISETIIVYENMIIREFCSFYHFNLKCLTERIEKLPLNFRKIEIFKIFCPTFSIYFDKL